MCVCVCICMCMYMYIYHIHIPYIYNVHLHIPYTQTRAGITGMSITPQVLISRLKRPLSDSDFTLV